MRNPQQKSQLEGEPHEQTPLTEDSAVTDLRSWRNLAKSDRATFLVENCNGTVSAASSLLKNNYKETESLYLKDLSQTVLMNAP